MQLKSNFKIVSVKKFLERKRENNPFKTADLTNLPVDVVHHLLCSIFLGGREDSSLDLTVNTVFNLKVVG